MSKKSPGSAGSLECPAKGEKNNLEHFSRNRPGWCYTESAGTKSACKETRVLPRSLFWQSGAATPLFCGPLHCKQLYEGAAPVMISSHWPALNTLDPCQGTKGVRAGYMIISSFCFNIMFRFLRELRVALS